MSHNEQTQAIGFWRRVFRSDRRNSSEPKRGATLDELAELYLLRSICGMIHHDSQSKIALMSFDIDALSEPSQRNREPRITRIKDSLHELIRDLDLLGIVRGSDFLNHRMRKVRLHDLLEAVQKTCNDRFIRGVVVTQNVPTDASVFCYEKLFVFALVMVQGAIARAARNFEGTEVWLRYEVNGEELTGRFVHIQIFTNVVLSGSLNDLDYRPTSELVEFAIARWVLERHSGHFSIEPRDGGTRISLALPALRED